MALLETQLAGGGGAAGSVLYTLASDCVHHDAWHSADRPSRHLSVGQWLLLL